jgi:hypothetical protein
MCVQEIPWISAITVSWATQNPSMHTTLKPTYRPTMLFSFNTVAIYFLTTVLQLNASMMKANSKSQIGTDMSGTSQLY